MLALNSARAKSRDAKRLADVRQFATALELYYNDKAFYPFSLQTLKPNYVTALPSAPLPPDGQCTPSDNEYYFYNIGAYHYTLDFCLGGETGSLKAGKHRVTPSGIQ